MRTNKRVQTEASRTTGHLRLQTFPHGDESIAASPQCPKPERSHAEIAFGSATALGSRVAEPGVHEPLVFESVKGAVERADRQRAPGSPFNLGPNRHPVGVVTKPKDSEENYLLELTEVLAAGHMLCIVELYDCRHNEVSVLRNRRAHEPLSP